MSSIGLHFAPWVKKGLLKIGSTRPSFFGLEMHLLDLCKTIEDFKPQATENFLYAGGNIAAASEISSPSIARFAGTAWSPVGRGLADSGGLGFAQSMSASDGRVAVVGWFKTAGTNESQRIAIWNEE